MADRLTFTLHELVAEIDAVADRALRQRHGVTFATFEFLAVLADVEPADMTTLARCLGVTKAAVSKRVPALEAEGWVRTEHRPGAGRSIHLTLTPRASDLVRTAGDELEAQVAAMFAADGSEEDPIDLAHLNRQLTRLTARVQRAAAHDHEPSTPTREH